MDNINQLLAHIKDDNGKQVAVYPALNNRTRQAGSGHPEELVRLNVYNELITKYHYPPEHIEIEFPVLIREDENPRFADIVVFDDKAHKRPLLVVETKQPGKSEGEKQGQRYATILRAVYVLWTNGSDRSTSVIVNRYPEDAAPISDIPLFGGAPQYSIKKLVPFQDDKQVTDTFRKCHNLIRNLSHLKPDDAFTEFLKVLLVKIQDEAKASEYEFQIFLRGQPPSPESSNETAQRIRLLFKVAVDEDNEIASSFKKGEDINLTNDCLAQIVRELQRYSFATTSIDQKGRAFETFLTGDLRQEFKEFMTPRSIVEAMIQMANPEPTDSILDPCCGSGAFLVYSLTHIRKKIEKKDYTQHQKIKQAFDFAHDKLWGFDASEQMSAVARINMLVNEDGRAHIFHHNSLLKRELAPVQVRNKLFDLILTNPPFGTKISQPSSLLDDFEIAKDNDGRVRKNVSFLTEVLFLERNLDWLKPDGIMLIVIPDSVLGNSTLTNERSYIERLARIVGVVSLSPDTFGPSGAKSKTSVLILQKRQAKLDHIDKNEDYPIFVAHIANVGYDFTGRYTSKNELPTLVEEFEKYRQTGISDTAVTKVITRKKLGKYWLAQPHVRVTTSNAIDKTSRDNNYWKLGDVCSVITTGKTAARSEYQASGGIHVIKVGNLTGRGIEFNAVERQYVSSEFAEKHSYAQLEKGDILFTAAAHGPKWIGLKVDIFETPPEYIDPPVLCCGEIMICRVSKERDDVDPYYLLLFLRSPAGYEAIQRCIRGQSGHVYPQDVSEILIPKPSNFEREMVERALSELKASLEARRKAHQHDFAANECSEKLFPSYIKKPIIAR